MVVESREIRLPQLPQLFAELNGHAQNLTFQKSMRETSVYLASEAKRNFSEGRDPDGNPWKPLKRQRNRKRDRRAKGGTGQKPLRDTGLLMASMSARGSGAVRDIGAFHLEQGTSISYGAFHQFGTRHIPARRFAGITSKMLDRIADFILADAVRQLTT